MASTTTMMTENHPDGNEEDDDDDDDIANVSVSLDSSGVEYRDDRSSGASTSSSSEVEVWSIIYGHDEQQLALAAEIAAEEAIATRGEEEGGGGQQQQQQQEEEEVGSPSNPTADNPMDSYREQLEQDIHRLVERQARLRQELERVEEEREQRQRRNSNGNGSTLAVSVLGRLLRIITYPITIVLTIVILILTLTFCIFPVVVFFITAICLYYCMIDDPMPVHLLLRYMFTPEHDEVAGGGGGGPYGNTSQRTFVSRKSISSKLIIRHLLKISSKNENERDVVASDDDDDDDGGIEYPRHHPFPIKIFTLSSTLHFSQPLREDDDDEEGESGDHINDGSNDVTVGVGANMVDTEPPFMPHYQRSFDSVTTSEQEQRRMNSIEVSSTSTNDDESSSSSSSSSSSNESNIDHAPTARLCEDVSNESDVTEDCGEITERNFEITGLEGDGEGSNANDGADTVVPGETRVAQGKSNDNGNDVQIPPSSNPGATSDYFGLDDGGDCRDKGTSCDICLLTFEVGDKVAFSPNCECSHHFHKDCILDWLQRKQTCPICRRDYLKGSEDGNV